MRILVIGGYGKLGMRLCELLAQEINADLIIGGRDLEKAKAFQQKLSQQYPTHVIETIEIDIYADDFEEKLASTGANIVAHLAGPFYEQEYVVARACIKHQMHYVDLADTRGFVCGMSHLDSEATASDVSVISGASIVPALSTAVVDCYAKEFGLFREIEIGIVAANKIDHGRASFESLLRSLGQPFWRLEKGTWQKVYGWQNAHRQFYGDNLGLRWHANYDVPELLLIPEKYTSVKTVVFHAGIELTVLHFGLWLMSILSRIKLVPNWQPLAAVIQKLSRAFKWFGCKTGGMYVHLSGSNHQFQPLDIHWLLVAEKGEGVYLPVIPMVIVIKKLIQGFLLPGARPCTEIMSMDDFFDFASKWNIYYTTEKLVR